MKRVAHRQSKMCKINLPHFTPVLFAIMVRVWTGFKLLQPHRVGAGSSVIEVLESRQEAWSVGSQRPVAVLRSRHVAWSIRSQRSVHMGVTAEAIG